jgi:hypothetical protein
MMGLPSTSLRIGERVLVRCDDGLLEAEYALFGPGDLVLRASDPVTVREAGYLTTAGDALRRLLEAGVSPELANRATRALHPDVVSSYARGKSVRAIVSQLGPYELFEGGVYRSSTQRYDGTWLDLGSLGSATMLQGAWAALQTMHLVTALTEVTADTPVLLTTAAATSGRRPSERTHRNIDLASVLALPNALRVLRPNARPLALDVFEGERQMRKDLVQGVRERAACAAVPTLRAHFDALEVALADAPPRGPLADPELRALDRQLVGGDTQGVDAKLDVLEKARGRGHGIQYVRARAAMVRGDESPRQVAERLSQVADSESGFYEADLLAARAWLAAGDTGHARYFARRISEDTTAPDGIRLVALEILDSTTETTRSLSPPPLKSTVTPKLPPPPAMPSEGLPTYHAAPAAKTWRRERVTVGSPGTAEQFSGVDVPVAALTSPMPAGVSLPPFVSEPPRPGEQRLDGAFEPPVRYHAELVESLALPPGANEAALAAGAVPTNALEARIAATRAARDLGRDYRLWYGTALRTDALAVDAMQRHLLLRFGGKAETSLNDADAVWELTRHGALLSEILARGLGAEWIDVRPTEPAYWAMLVPPSTRTWPIARVYRFVTHGHRERDLVSYYLDLDARARTRPR